LAKQGQALNVRTEADAVLKVRCALKTLRVSETFK